MSSKSKIQSAKIGAITQKADKNSVAPLSDLTYSSGVVYNTNPAPPITKVNRTFQSDSGTVIVQTDKDVYVNTVENIVEQKYINNLTAGALDVGTVSGTDYTNVASGVYKLGFDTDSGFNVTDLGAGVAKIAMNSTFKYWNVDGSPGLIACGLDTVNFVAGSGVTITSNNSVVPKSLTISASESGVSSINSLTGAVTLSAGSNISIGTSGNTLTICGTSSSVQATPTILGTVFGCTDTYGLTALGYCAGNTNTTGYDNIAIGQNSLAKNTYGNNNIAIGAGALYCNTTSCNIAIGIRALGQVYSNSCYVSRNIMMGYEAGRCGGRGDGEFGSNIGIGDYSLELIRGMGNIGIGCYALNYGMCSESAIAIGGNAIENTKFVCHSIGIGANALSDLQDSQWNIAIGSFTMNNNLSTASNNIAIGSFALTGSGGLCNCVAYNVAVGEFALSDVCNTSKNSAFGFSALTNNTTGNTNIGIGYCAGACITTGSNNTVIGSLTGTPGLVCTVLIGAGTCERIKVDDNGLCINGALFNTSPGGCNTQFQYNNSGSFAGACGLTYDSATCSVGMTKITVPQNQSLQINVSSTEKAWYATYGDFYPTTQDDFSSQVVYDADGNSYIIGSDGNDGIVVFLVKYDSVGNLLWQKQFSEVNNYYKTGDALAIGPDGNLICIVGTDDSVNDITIFKITPTGTILWQTTLIGVYVAGTDLIADSSNNVYACLFYDDGSDSQCLVKLNSSGVLQWQKVLSGNSRGYPFGIALDNNDNILITGTTSLDGTYNTRRVLLSKYDPSGNLLFQYVYATVAGTGVTLPGQITVDSSDNIYIVGNFDPGTGYESGYVAKLNNNGNILWQKNFTQNTSAPGYYYLRFYGVSLDSSGNVYVAGYGRNSPDVTSSDLIVVKLDNSGTVLWSRTFGGVDGDYAWYYWAAKMIDVYQTSYVVSGYTYSASPGNGEAITFQMPTDGSLLGTYGLFTYAIANFTIDSDQFVKSTGTETASDGILVPNPGAYTLIAGTQTNNTYKISGGDNVFTIDSNGTFSLPNYSLPFSSPSEKQTLVSCNNVVTWSDPSLFLNGTNSLRISAKSDAKVLCGSNNLAVGYCSLGSSPTFGCNNTAIGYGALKSNSVGSNNIVFGCNSMTNAIGPSNNFMAGALAGYCACFGFNNIGIGKCSLYNLDQANNNVALGYGTLKSIRNAGNNTAIGNSAAANLCTDDGYSHGNVAIGLNALYGAKCGLNNVAIGVCAMRCASATHNNIALGLNTLYSATVNSYDNIALGDGSHYSRACGDNNIGIGTRTFAYAVSGWQNIAIGYESQDTGGHGGAGNISLGYWSLRNVSNSYDNVAIGANSQYCHVTGSHNITVGYGTLRNNLCGNDNIALGADSQRCNICGVENISMGSRSLYSNTTGNNNIAIGVLSMYNNVRGEKNIAIGFRTLENNTTGNYSVAIGQYAGFLNRSATITAVGDSTLSNNTTGSNNVAVGSQALNANTTGSFNTGVGFNALSFNTVGCNNVALGYEAHKWGTTGCNSIAIGAFALTNNSGVGNTALGHCALACNTTGANNIALGPNALKNNSIGSRNIAIGTSSMICGVGGSYNTAVGDSSMYGGGSGESNVAIGWGALYTTQCLGASQNVAVGNFALQLNNTGYGNVAVGSYGLGFSPGGRCNTAIGFKAGIPPSLGYTCGCNNTFIGSYSCPQTLTSSNTITLGNASISCIRAQVTTISALSDQRDKTNIEDLPLGLEFVMDLRPVKFTWNMRDGGKVGVDDTGFIAQEVLTVEDKYNVQNYLDMVGRENPDKLEVKPAKLIPILVKAIQELNEIVATQGAELAKLKSLLN